MRFVETPVFTQVLTGLIDDESYRTLQVSLLLRPEQGPLIRGGGGLRKIRWALPGRGKSGGIRVIYHWEPGEETFYMLFAYAKKDQGDLTPAQIRLLARLIREEFA